MGRLLAYKGVSNYRKKFYEIVPMQNEHLILTQWACIKKTFYSCNCCIIDQVAWNKSSLLLKIFFQNYNCLQR
jgi:hypothetical protein